MIIQKQAIGEDIAHKIEIYCPACSRDVDTAELDAKKCNDCGADLSAPQQNITVAVTSVPAFAVTF
jgi:Zn finger protein HypA/HybF involved in hydrogenase expression